MVLHDDINEIFHRSIFVSHQHLRIEHLVVAEDIIDHLLIEILRRRGEGRLHTPGFFLLQIDVWRVTV